MFLIFTGAAVIATDFRPDPHGFVRILVVDRALTAAQAGALVQRVLGNIVDPATLRHLAGEDSLNMTRLALSLSDRRSG